MIMQNWFNPSSEVKISKELFGWNKPNGFLDGLVNIIVKGRSHVQILGERRAGKSSILNCISHEIKKDITKTKLIPVIVNFNTHLDSVNSDNGYNLFSACVLNELGKIEEIKPRSTIKIANITINKANDVGGYLNNLSNLSKQKTKSFLKNLISDIAGKEYSVLLLIDEYEAMFQGIFLGKKGSLYGIRNLVMGELPNDLDFQCCITGTRRWSDHYNDIGSDDFNFINDTQFIPYLDFQEAKELILYGFTKSNKEINKRDIPRIFKLSAGSPFLIMSICNSYILHGGIDTTILLNKLDSHFHSIWQRLNYNQKLIFKKYSEMNNSIDYLQKLNLLKTKNRYFWSKKISPKGQLWNEFVSSQEVITQDTIENLNELEENQRIAELKQIAEITNTSIDEISSVLEGKDLDVLFDLKLSPSYFNYAARLFNPCYTKDTFSEFIVALYVIIFESTARHYISKFNPSKLDPVIDEIKKTRKDMHIFQHWTKDNIFIFHNNTKEVNTEIKEIKKLCRQEGFKPTFTDYPRNMAAFPPQFSRFPVRDDCPDEFHVINILRHKWAEGHDTRSKNFEADRFTSAQAQERYLGHKNTPVTVDWYTMQLGVLKDLNKVLVSILNWANEQ